MGRPVVCDVGSGVVKAGFAAELEPSLVFPNLVGRLMPQFDSVAAGDPQCARGLLVGDEALSARATLQHSRPMQSGIVQDWDDMEAVWDHTFAKLGIAPSEHKVVHTEPAMNPARHRERVVETLFEKYGFQGVNISIQAVLALNSQGLTTGFVVDAGDGVAHLVPVTEGYLEPSLVQRVNLAGQHVTQQLMKLLVGQGHPLNSRADLEMVRELKQKLCYVAYDLDAECKLAQETTLVDRQYTLPDSRTMRISAERFLAPEIIFSPMQNGQDSPGLAQLVFDTIRRSDVNVQKELFGHIVLSGGTTMFPGFSSRLERDLRRLFLDKVLQGDKSRLSKFPIRVDDPPRRQHMVFLGASILAEAHEQQPTSPWWILRQEYEECGASAVHRLIPTKLS